MKKIFILTIAALIAMAGFAVNFAGAEEKVIFNYEKDTQGWAVPEWALEQQDHVAKSVEISKKYAKEGQSSLEVMANFNGKAWTGAMIEDAEYFDWTPYKEVACDIYLPKEAPEGLKARLILTVGENWKFTEMSRAIPLIPGQWVTVSASIAPGSEDWKKTVVDDNFRKDIRKLGIRVESNKKPAYEGAFYIDNFRVIK